MSVVDAIDPTSLRLGQMSTHRRNPYDLRIEGAQQCTREDAFEHRVSSLRFGESSAASTTVRRRFARTNGLQRLRDGE